MKIVSRYGLALGVLFTAYVLQASSLPVISVLVDALFILLLVVVILDPESPRWSRVAGACLVTASAASTVAYNVLQQPMLGTASTTLNASVLALAIFLVVRRISMQEAMVTLSTVMGAVLAYALLAFVFANIYNAMDLATSGGFFTQTPVDQGDYSYFSFMTITTVGFGDLSPASDLAKRVVVVQAFIGQIFLVVLVARLVSLWGSGMSNAIAKNPNPTDRTD